MIQTGETCSGSPVHDVLIPLRMGHFLVACGIVLFSFGVDAVEIRTLGTILTCHAPRRIRIGESVPAIWTTGTPTQSFDAPIGTSTGIVADSSSTTLFTTNSTLELAATVDSKSSSNASKIVAGTSSTAMPAARTNGVAGTALPLSCF